MTIITYKNIQKSILIKLKIQNLNLSDQDHIKIFNNIWIKVINDGNNKQIYKLNPKKLENFQSFTVEDDGKYKVCIHRPRLIGISKMNVYIQMNVITDNTIEKNLDKALKDRDMTIITDKIGYLIEKSRRVIEYQEKEVEIEDAFANMQVTYIKDFVLFAFLQIFVIVCIGSYHIFSFRKFLINNGML